MLQLSKLAQMVMHLTCFQQIPGYNSSQEFCIFPDPTTGNCQDFTLKQIMTIYLSFTIYYGLLTVTK